MKLAFPTYMKTEPPVPSSERSSPPTKLLPARNEPATDIWHQRLGSKFAIFPQDFLGKGTRKEGSATARMNGKKVLLATRAGWQWHRPMQGANQQRIRLCVGLYEFTTTSLTPGKSLI